MDITKLIEKNEVTVTQLFDLFSEDQRLFRIIDVRRPDEYNNELGHIDGAELITLGSDLTSFLETGDRTQVIVFVCRSGVRSGVATEESIRLGYKYTLNLVGGMLSWNEKKFPVVKE